MKPLGHKSYGSIPHLTGSRLGPGDHHCHKGQEIIATEKRRDKHDIIIVQEKLDGGNVAIAKLNGEILALTRSGYLASTSPYKTHHVFKQYVGANNLYFKEVLKEGERLCGEWLFTAVGTKYNLPHCPFVVFDIMVGKERKPYSEVRDRCFYFNLPIPRVLSEGNAFPVESAIDEIKVSGHGALEPVEGAVWRVERKGIFDFMVKYVRPDKVDGKYLEESPINGLPEEFKYLLKYT